MNVPEVVAGAMWTASEERMGFTSALVQHIHQLSDVLALAVDAAGVDENTAAALAEILSAVQKALRAVFTFSPRASGASAANLLRRSLLRAPFFHGQLGYPHGAPRTHPGSSLAAATGQVALGLAREFAVHAALWIFCGSQRLNWEAVSAAKTPEELPEWNLLRDCCRNVPGFLHTVMTELLDAHREAELEAVPRVIPSAFDGRVDAIWTHFLKSQAPDLLWLFTPTTDALIGFSTAYNGNGIMLADNAAEHRALALDVAQIAWVAEGRPLAPSKRLKWEMQLAAAQRRHLTAHADRALSSEELVRALLDLPPAEPSASAPLTSSAWVDAAAIAAGVPDEDTKCRLSIIVLARCFTHDGTAFVSVAQDHEMGDRSKMEQLNNTLSGTCVRMNAPLQRLIAAEREEIAHATSDEYAKALREWLEAVVMT
jgi:hypothetical protein